MSCVEKEKKTVAELEKALEEEDMKLHLIHYFRVNWQHQQLSLNQNKLQGELLITTDFSENYQCSYKMKVSLGFFNLPKSLSIRSCRISYISSETLVKHAIVGISPDLQHDAHLIKAFEEKMLCSYSPSKLTRRKVFKRTDGCVA